jgi:hypothetical protein
MKELNTSPPQLPSKQSHRNKHNNEMMKELNTSPCSLI